MTPAITWTPSTTTTTKNINFFGTENFAKPENKNREWRPVANSAETKLSALLIKHQQLYLSRLSGNKYHLLCNLLLEIEYGEDERVVIREERSEVYGAGHDLKEAVEDFQSMLEERYEHLTLSENVLSHTLYEQLAYLRSILVPCQ